MRWVTYLSPQGGGERVGLVRDGKIHGLTSPLRLLDLLGEDMDRLRGAGLNAEADPYEVIEFDDARLRAPIPIPPSIRDFLAFEQHVKTIREGQGGEMSPDWYELPVFYFSNPAGVHGPRDDVAISPGSEQFDYELEVAAVVGRGGSDLSPEEAEANIAGYLVLGDWSARDLQFREMAQHLGPAKGKDSATSMGPVLVTPDELEPWRDGSRLRLEMRASVNGVDYSAGNLGDLYWSFGQMMAYASRGTRLTPGDVIGSGTVGTGCILELALVHGTDRYPWLKAGDDVRLEVEQLGAIVATIRPGSIPKPLR
jgi:2-keto-4-pentenoate hydratase/2-oxohepta-3-ene-1,7-dioic acid hydratase in catechol pathway